MPEESIIDQCRQRFTGRSRGLLGFFNKSRPAWERDCAQDEISPDAEPHYRILLQHGRVVWGCIAQANAGLFGIGTTNLPANTIYSNDSFYDLNPAALEAVAMAIYSLKDSVPEDPQLRQIAATITDERNYALNLPVPKVLTLGREVLFTTTVIRRKRLPSGYLAARLLPLVICPERTPQNMVLPLRFWTDRLQSDWRKRNAELRASGAVKAPARREGSITEGQYLANPVRLTPKAGREIRMIIAQQRLAPDARLVIDISNEGGMYVYRQDLQDGPVKRRYFATGISEGVTIAIPDSFAATYLQGTVIDLKETPHGKGFVFQNPNVHS